MLRKPLEAQSLLAALERAGVRSERPGGILVVDDDPGALRLMDAALTALGFAAITRSSGRSALEAAKKLQPTAVVLDLVMPGMDGVEFLDRFRRMPEHLRTPVLIWTMKDLDGRRAGAASPLGAGRRLEDAEHSIDGGRISCARCLPEAG